MKVCATELKVSDWQMIAWSSWSCDTVKGRQCMADDRYRVCHYITLKVKVASLNLMRHSVGSQWSCLRSSVEIEAGKVGLRISAEKT